MTSRDAFWKRFVTYKLSLFEMNSKSVLNSLKILDFTSLLPGPYCTQILSDLGASVLRVESPTRPDLARITPPMVRKNVSAIHAQLNRNKHSLALDLKKEGSKQVIKELVEAHGYDIIVEGFRPGVMQKLGLGYDTLQQINGDLIYVSITGYGQKGSYSMRAGHDINYLALSGMASYSEGKPSLYGTQIADIAGGSHHGVIGLLSAVVQRQAAVQSGSGGQHVDVSMADAAFGLNCMYGATSLFSGTAPTPGREVLNGGNPCYAFYETSDGRYMSVGALEPQFALAFLKAIGKDHWAPRLAKTMVVDENDQNTDSEQHREGGQKEKSLKEDIAGVIQSRTQAEWVEVFEDIDCCVEPVLDVLEAANHKVFLQRNMTTTVPLHEQRAKRDVAASAPFLLQVSPPIKFSRSNPAPLQFAGRDVGADTEDVLKDILGRSVEEIRQMREDGCI